MTSTELWLVRVLCVCTALFFSDSGQADSWIGPREFDTPSANGKFVAHVIPREQQSKPLLIVSAVSRNKTTELWRSELSNRVSPIQVFVSDDGESAVTLDNWGGIGYGDDVVAIYNRNGQLAQYSLERIAPPPKANPEMPRRLFSFDGYGGKFIHSTSSRRWRDKSIEFFIKDAGQLLFGLWVDWDDRWVAWQMSDGQLIRVTSEQTKKFNAEGRRRALEQAKSGSLTSSALGFLGRLRFNEDRPLVEAWLRDTEFSGGAWQSSSSEKTEPVFAFTARSYKRAAADEILTRWDGKDSGNAGLGSLDQYKFLGTLKCSVALATAPAKKEGTIRLYLIPESTSLKGWASASPAQYLIADLTHSFPYIFEGGVVRDRILSNVVNLVIYGATPGRYRLKAVWDRAAPFAKKDEVICQPLPGDYESTTSPLISIHKGLVTEGVRLECNSLVAK